MSFSDGNEKSVTGHWKKKKMILVTKQQSPTFWHQGQVSWKTVFPWTGDGGDGSGGNASDGERQMKLLSLATAHLLSVIK